MKNVLIVEDDDVLRSILIEHFTERLNFDSADYAADGAEGLIRTRDKKYDVICLDHNMPYMTGLEILEVIRKKEGPNQTTPVIMISSDLPELDDENGSDIYYLRKPIEEKRLDRYVKMILKGN